MRKKTISILTPCWNEKDNIEDLYRQVKVEFERNLLDYEYEHIFIDNHSSDSTPEILRKLAAADPKVKVIFNSRNFGHIRSPFYGLIQCTGDATMLMAADLQDPPNLIPEFIKKWENGNEIVIGVKSESEESAIMFFIRKLYYNLINRLSEIPLTKNFTGFGLYDRKIIDILKVMDDPYPYFRGLIFEIGFNSATVPYVQPKRKRGITKNNFFTLYDVAMLGICSHSKVPLRIATISGFLLSIFSLTVAFCYFVAKLLYWNNFSIGMAPIVIGIFFFSSVQLFFLGIIGEYIGFIFTKMNKRPLVVEIERLNFNDKVANRQKKIHGEILNPKDSVSTGIVSLNSN